ncbi:hypothetical protein V2J09_022092 [Rumex salicifolius]
MPPQPKGDPQDWLEIALSSDNNTIYIRIHLDNLYLVGYRTKSGSWREFSRKDKEHKLLPPLIPGSQLLGFEGSYVDLQRKSNKPVIGTLVSRQIFTAVVDELSNTNATISSIAKNLTILVMVISEATRFEAMSRRFADAMHKDLKTAVEIEDWMTELFTSWGLLSGKLLRADTDGDKYFSLPSNTCNLLRKRIKSALDASAYLGILCDPS